jgi:signal recognition particle GTPase
MSLHLILKLAEEREKPELLAESRERRIRVAEESEKTEQEVQSYSCDHITLFFLCHHSAPPWS